MDVYTALADPTRRRIIEMLATNGELAATAIHKKFKTSPPAISQHLKVLREAKLVSMERRAQQRIYYLNPATMSELEKWVQKMTERWNARFSALDAVLAAERNKINKGSEKK